MSLLQLRRGSARAVVLAVNPWRRVLYGGAAALIYVSLAVAGEQQPLAALVPSGRNAVAHGLALLSVLTALYQERWLFDGVAATVEHRFGLLFAFRRRRWQRAELEAVQLGWFLRGVAPGVGPSHDQGAAAPGTGRAGTGDGEVGSASVDDTTGGPGLAGLLPARGREARSREARGRARRMVVLALLERTGRIVKVEVARATSSSRLAQAGRAAAAALDLPFTDAAS